jgi:predicted dehydrogenase
MARKIRAGIIGTGLISKNHIDGYQRLPDAEVVACCDIDADRVEQAGEQYGIPHRFTSVEKMLKLDELDCVSICTPNYDHKTSALKALKAGKHVLCEKPMAMNAREGQQMVNAAEAAGKQLQISLNFRFRPEVQFCKRVIEEGAIGTPYYGRSQSIRRRGVPSWGVFGQKKLQGGGPLIDIGVHCIDWTWYLMGCPRPVAVSGQTYETIGATPGHIGQFGVWDHKTYDVEDFATALVRFENGATMNVESAFCVNLDKNQMGCHVAGDKGGVSTDPVTVQTSIAGHLVDGTPNHLQGGKLKTHWLSVEGFVKAIAAGKEVPIPASQVLWVQKIIDAIYKSAERGKEVEIK